MDRVRLSDDVEVTVMFRSPDKIRTIWNGLGWGLSSGLRLYVVDSSGHEVKQRYVEPYEVAPPNPSGKDELISIGGAEFAGFNSRIPVRSLVPGPGKYTIKCVYNPPLPRDYFPGHTIWGEEDGVVESVGVSIAVDKR
jgi:hypothetical protein